MGLERGEMRIAEDEDNGLFFKIITDALIMIENVLCDDVWDIISKKN